MNSGAMLFFNMLAPATSHTVTQVKGGDLLSLGEMLYKSS